MMTVTSTLRHLLDELDRCRPWIEAAIGKGAPTHTFDDFSLMVMQNRVRFWPLPNAFMATEIVTYPQCKHLHVWLAGGDLDEIKAQQEALVEAAIANGCDKLTLTGRPGWVRSLHELGWKPGPQAVYFSIDAATQLPLFGDESEAA